MCDMWAQGIFWGSSTYWDWDNQGGGQKWAGTARRAEGPSLEFLWDPLLSPQNASWTHSPIIRAGWPKYVEFGETIWSPRKTSSPSFSNPSVHLAKTSSHPRERWGSASPGDVQQRFSSDVLVFSWASNRAAQELWRRKAKCSSRYLLGKCPFGQDWGGGSKSSPLWLITTAVKYAAL